MTIERWSQFSKDKQLIMIANEMNRFKHLSEHPEAAYESYCTTLELTDLTLSINTGLSFRIELARFRELFADIEVQNMKNEERRQFLEKLQQTLLELHPLSYFTSSIFSS